MKALLKKLPGIRFLRGGWPDAARLIVQRPIFQHILAGSGLGGACLNAGCGEGLFVLFLDRLKALTRIVHLDLAKPALGHFKLDYRHTAAEGSLGDLPFSDGEFDFVFCTEVLEHITDDARAFREISRVLRPGGLVLLSTPTPPAPHDPALVRDGYTLDELRKQLRNAGIEQVKHAYCFHAPMRLLVKIWRSRYDAEKRKSGMPLAMVIILAYCDRWFRFGKPFDIVVLGRKMSI